MPLVQDQRTGNIHLHGAPAAPSTAGQTIKLISSTRTPRASRPGAGTAAPIAWRDALRKGAGVGRGDALRRGSGVPSLSVSLNGTQAGRTVAPLTL
jgi:hypothetical protein